MEYLKKKIYRIMTTGATAPCSYRNPETGVLITGCTATTKLLIPNTGVTYYVKFSLTQDAQDIGFFDAYTVDTPFNYINVTGITSGLTIFEKVLSGQISLGASGLPIVADSGYISGTTIIPTNITITGYSSSRLVELRKYVVSGTTAQIYVTGGTTISDGIILSQSVGNKIVYYLGGIKYTDVLTGDTSGTTFTFIGQGLNSANFINKPIYKDMNKENIISNPKIFDDVFIVRQEVSAFDGNYRLEYVQSLVDLTTYAGGNFFNIVNNT